MPTIIDSLIIELGLDPSGYDAGRAKAAQALRGLKDEATKAATAVEQQTVKVVKGVGTIASEVGGGVKSFFSAIVGGMKQELNTLLDQKIAAINARRKAEAEAMEHAKKATSDHHEVSKKHAEHSRHHGEELRKLREHVLLLAAAFTGGKELKEFISETIVAAAEQGRLAHVLGQNVSALSAWSGAVYLAGGSVQAAQQTVATLLNDLNTFSITTKSNVLQYFRAFQIEVANADGSLKSFDQIMRNTVKRMDEIGIKGAKRGAALRLMGFDPGSIDLMLNDLKHYDEALEKQKRLGITTPEEAEAFKKLQEAWRELGQASETTGRQMLAAMAPTLEKIMHWLTELAIWSRDHQPLIHAAMAAIATVVIALTAALLAPIAGLLAFAAAAAAAAAAIVLLYDDWKTWMEGGESEFEDFYNKFADAAKKVIAILKNLWETAKNIWGLIVAVLTGSGKDIRNAWNKLFGDIDKDLVEWAAQAAKKVAYGIWDALKSIPGTVWKWFTDRKEAIQEGVQLVKQGTSALSGVGGRFSLAAAEGTKLQDAMGISPEQWDAFRRGLAALESSGGNYKAIGGASGRFSGAYQFGAQEIADTARKLGEPTPTREQFLNDPKMQERFLDAYTKEHHAALLKSNKWYDASVYASLPLEKKLQVLAYAHNQGAGWGSGRIIGAQQMLMTGKFGSDANNTSGYKYIQSVENQQKNPPPFGPTGILPGQIAVGAGTTVANDNSRTSNINRTSSDMTLGSINQYFYGDAEPEGVSKATQDALQGVRGQW